MIDCMDSAQGDRPDNDARPSRRLARAGVGLVVAAGVLLGLGVAGAATGVLDTPPRPILAEEPGDDDGTTTTVDSDDTTTTAPEEPTTTLPDDTTTTLPEDSDEPASPSDESGNGFDRGPDPNGPAKQGLCRAFGHRGSDPGKSVAAANLRAAAAEAGVSVADFCGNPAESGPTSKGTGPRTEGLEGSPPPSTPVSPRASDRAEGRTAPGSEGRGPAADGRRGNGKGQAKDAPAG
jgi:hypothetical protein